MMKRALFLVAAGTLLIASVVIWRSFQEASPAQEGGFNLEGELSGALMRLREVSPDERKTSPLLVNSVVTFADALATGGDVRQKQVAIEAKKEAGRILFGEVSIVSDTPSAVADQSARVVPFPGKLPEQRFTPLPLRSYVGTYEGSLLGLPVSFVITITDRSLLGVRIIGIGNQPAMEFAETKPQEFFRPDSMAMVEFVDPVAGGFRTLYFRQHGILEKAENTAFSPAAGK